MTEEKFTFNGKTKLFTLGLAILGLILVLIAIFTSQMPGRIWGSFLTASWYFLGFSLGALVILSINYLSSSGWAVIVKRVTEGISTYLPPGAVLFAVPLLIYLLFINSHHNFYHWTHEHLDALLQKKTGYLNLPFFTIRMILILGLWSLFAYLFRKYSLNEENAGSLSYHKKSYRTSAVFLPVFAITISMASWDWFMSLEPHWYSTIFAVYVFAGIFVGGWTLMALFSIFLQSRGYLKEMNSNHYHDIGKFIFGFSIFWCYIWLSQFLLIWYGNIPEEVTYFYHRMHGGWEYLFYINVIINFALPFLLLMMNTAKRSKKMLILTGIIILAGRWIDLYLLAMPGAMGHDSLPTFGLPEIGFTLLFGGIFLFQVLKAFSKVSLIAKNHPYLKESLHHEVL